MNNGIYIRRRKKIALLASTATERLPLEIVASGAKNVEALGFALSEPLFEAMRALSADQLAEVYADLISSLMKLKGAHQTFKPMYPNFPAQVMAASEAQLYFNAIVHYWTAGRFLPVSQVDPREPLAEATALHWIDLGTTEEFERLFASITGSNGSLSGQDKEDLEWFVRSYGDEIGPLMPAAIPQKETVAHVAGLLLVRTQRAAEFISAYCKTATDVLRLACAMSEGDVSLATATKFRTFSRPERRVLLSLLDRQPNATEDMLRFPERWKRLGEKLHVGEFKGRYPNALEAFKIVRNDLPFATFNGAVEKALGARDVAKAVSALASRPGDFARRLDHVLRIAPDLQRTVIEDFRKVAPKVSTPVLLQVATHFLSRPRQGELRVFFPKGNLAKVQGIESVQPDLPDELCMEVSELCEEALMERFAALPPLERTYIDPALKSYMAPFAMRSASKSFRTLVRGTKLPLPPCKTLRFFVWWKNGADRTDIDLSAAMLDAEFDLVDSITYYNLVSYGGCHSGDIIDAPDGASEFIDIDLDRVRTAAGRYVVMILNSYTHQPYSELPECFAGWMARSKAGSGEIYEPKTVQDRLDITATTRIAVPIVFDLVDNRVIWCDMALRRNPSFQNNLHGNLKGINLTVKAITALKKPSLYELFMLHARARGRIVDSADVADTVFSVENGTPFRIDEIASQYMA